MQVLFRIVVCAHTSERQSGKIPENEYEQSIGRKIETREKNKKKHMHCEWWIRNTRASLQSYVVFECN